MQMQVDAVVVGERYRHDLGDIEGLAKSMKDVGLLQPIVVAPGGRLIAGQRRLEAAKRLGWDAIEVHEIDLDELLTGEWTENVVRKDFSPLEKAALGAQLEKRERELAAERQHATRAKPGERIGSGDSSPPIERGKTRDLVGAALGMSGPTYSKMKTVANAASADPETFGPIAEEMDCSGNVERAFVKVQEARGARDRSVAGREARDARIIAMAEAGHQIGEIARQARLSRERTQQILNAAGVETVSKRIGARHNVDGNRAMQRLIESSYLPVEIIEFLEKVWDDLDRQMFGAWDTELSATITTLTRLRTRLRRDNQ